MFRQFYHNKFTSYWLKVFALYALVEVIIQLLFFVTINSIKGAPVSQIEIHLLMWLFQCLLIWPIWLVAWWVKKKSASVQIIVNIVFYIIYSYLWFGPVQDVIGYLYHHLQQFTRPENNRIEAVLDSGSKYSYLNYQLLKHAFRLSWFYMAAYFYVYRLEQQKRIALAVANKELQLKMLKWHLNPSFYFKTIQHLQLLANDKPVNATGPILQLAKVMEYVIYEAKEKWVLVKKELQFINNYTDLLNQQNNNSMFQTEVYGNYGDLKISPLLLAGFIDKIAAANLGNQKILFRMQLFFSGNEVTVTIDKDAENSSGNLLTEDNDLQQQLNDSYPGKFSFTNIAGSNQFKLIIPLHEEN